MEDSPDVVYLVRTPKGMLTPEKPKAVKVKRVLSDEQKAFNKNKLMLNKYNITLDEYNAIAKAQDYRCLICSRVRKLTIDHDHNCCPDKGSCGECIRGLICSQCNTILGMCNDDVSILTAAIAYLT